MAAKKPKRKSVFKPRGSAMRCPMKKFLLSTVLLCALGSTGRSQPPPTPTTPLRVVPNFVTVTDQTMRAPKAEDWLIHRGNYQAWGRRSAHDAAERRFRPAFRAKQPIVKLTMRRSLFGSERIRFSPMQPPGGLERHFSLKISSRSIFQISTGSATLNPVSAPSPTPVL
jgi:hypothetical protein